MRLVPPLLLVLPGIALAQTGPLRIPPGRVALPAAVEGFPVREGYLTGAGGVRLHYRVVGIGHDTLLFLHGGPGFGMSDAAYDVESVAAHGFTFITFDQRGSGRSEAVTDSSRLGINANAADVEEVRAFFRLESVAVVGAGWGAMLAVRYAVRHPTHVTRLVLVGPGPPTDSFLVERFVHLDSLRAAPDRARLRELQAAWSDAPDSALPRMCREFFDVATGAYLVQRSRWRERRGDVCADEPWVLRTLWRRQRASIRSLGDTFDLRPEIARLRVPVLVVEGACTTVPLDATRAWATSARRGRLVLVGGAGHYSWLDRTDGVAATIGAWLHHEPLPPAGGGPCR